MLKNAFYSALCTDNSTFWSTGKIKVRIFKFSGFYSIAADGKPTSADDIANTKLKDYEKIEKIDSGVTTTDFDAFVFTPLGGGKNYGLFMLPQVNSKGVVTFLDDDQSKLMWMGSFFENVVNPSNGKLTNNINIPNDVPEREGPGSNKDDFFGIVNKVSKLNSGNKAAPIILRTRHTVGGSASGVDWGKGNNTENLMVLGDSIIRLRHNTSWDNDKIKKYQEILIYQDKSNSSKETIELDVNNVDGNKRGIFKVTEDGFNLTVMGSGDSLYNIYTSSDGLHIKTDVANSKKIFLDGEGNQNIVSLVTYDQLKTIVEAFRDHIHYGDQNSLKTTTPYASDNSPIKTKVDQPTTKMEAENIKTKEKA